MMRRNFRLRLWLSAVLPALLLTGVFAVVLSHWTRTVLESSMRERVEAVARQLATASEFHLITGDVATLRGLVDGLAKDETEIVAMAIVDQDGQLWASRGMPPAVVGFPVVATWSSDAVGKRMQLVMPVAGTPLKIDDFVWENGEVGSPAATGKPLGYVVLSVSRESLNRERDRILFLAVVAFLAAALAGGGLAVMLARSVTAPLGRVIAVVERIGQGDLDARIDDDDECVLSPLIKGVNQMAANVALTQDDMRRRIDEATRELRVQKLDAEREARIDPLTGLNNRRAFFEYAERDVRRSARYDFPVALIMLDLDHFKSINDEHGHPVGDRVLVALAETLLKSMREVDVLGRLGGEEFAILMPDTGAEEATQAAERIREAIADVTVMVEETVIHFTASFGIAVFGRADDTIHDLFTRADRALYQAKQRGRNRVEVFGA